MQEQPPCTSHIVCQALPVYLVHFEFDPEMPELLNLPLCDHCGLQAAMAAFLTGATALALDCVRLAVKFEVYCEADDAIFCRPCDGRIHSANKLAARHIRVDINRRPNAPLGSCPDHAGSEADMYCTDASLHSASHFRREPRDTNIATKSTQECKVPVCQHCRKLGSHSAGSQVL